MARKNRKPKKRKGDKKAKIFDFIDLENNPQSLTILQKKFVDAYLGESDMNACQAIIDADYDVADRDSAKALGYDNLRKDNVKAYVAVVLDRQGFNDTNVDFEHLKAIKQDDKWSAKVSAIREYNDMRGRHAPEKREGEIKVIIDK